MSRSSNIEGESQQVASSAPIKQVDTIRAELEQLMEDALVLEDIDSLLGIAQEMGQYLIHLQWKEQQLLPLITDAKARYNIAQEEVRVAEDREALRLNDAGIAMNRADKMARIAMSEIRSQLNAFQEARNRYEDEHADLRGFRTVVEACKMTLHQKIKSLMSEYRATPYQTER